MDYILLWNPYQAPGRGCKAEVYNGESREAAVDSEADGYRLDQAKIYLDRSVSVLEVQKQLAIGRGRVCTVRSDANGALGDLRWLWGGLIVRPRWGLMQRVTGFCVDERQLQLRMTMADAGIRQISNRLQNSSMDKYEKWLRVEEAQS